VAHLLARHNRVIFVDPPLAWSPTTPAYMKNQWRRVLRGSRQVTQGVEVLPTPTIPFGRIAAVRAANRALVMANLHRVARACRDSSVIVWAADTHVGPMLSEVFSAAPLVFHALDVMTNPSEAAAARELARRAALVLGATPTITSGYASSAVRAATLRNGWSFPPAALADGTVAEDVARIPRPRVGLVGYLGPTIDYELLDRLVARLDVWLVCVGRRIGRLESRERAYFERLRRSPRVVFLGERPTEQLPAYIRGFVVCLAPYKRNPRVYASDPLKVYQYLALGRPVISTPVGCLENSTDVVNLAPSADAFISMVATELSRPADPRLDQSRADWAAGAHWHRRWRDLTSLLAGIPELRSLTGPGQAEFESQPAWTGRELFPLEFVRERRR
jgi:hypothetical protein